MEMGLKSQKRCWAKKLDTEGVFSIHVKSRVGKINLTHRNQKTVASGKAELTMKGHKETFLGVTELVYVMFKWCWSRRYIQLSKLMKLNISAVCVFTVHVNYALRSGGLGTNIISDIYSWTQFLSCNQWWILFTVKTLLAIRFSFGTTMKCLKMILQKLFYRD